MSVECSKGACLACRASTALLLPVLIPSKAQLAATDIHVLLPLLAAVSAA